MQVRNGSLRIKLIMEIWIQRQILGEKQQKQKTE